jgi:anti-sigma B factor antagonist
MDCTISEQQGVHCVQLTGELTDETAAEFIDAVTDLFAGPQTRIVLALAGVTFLNSTGLGQLVRLVSQANTQECRVVLAALRPFVAGVLTTTRLDRFFEVYESVAQATAALRPKS